MRVYFKTLTGMNRKPGSHHWNTPGLQCLFQSWNPYDSATSFYDSRPSIASRLNFPGPRAARYNHRKQYRTVISPPFRCGKKLWPGAPGGTGGVGPITVPAWLMKYATA